MATAAEERTPAAFRRALSGLREDGPTFERLTAIGHEIVGRRHASGFTSAGPSMSAWKKLAAADGKDTAGLPAWKYVELLVLAYVRHHDLPEEEATRLLAWADCYTACGGWPRPQYRRVTEPPPPPRAGTRRRSRLLYVVGAVTAVIALAAATYAVWDDDPGPPLSVDDVPYLGLSKGDYVFPSVMKLSDSEVRKLAKEDYGKGRTFEEWFTQNKGVPAQYLTVSLTVSGRTEKQLRITNLELRKQDCTPPPPAHCSSTGARMAASPRRHPCSSSWMTRFPNRPTRTANPTSRRRTSR